MKTFLFFAALCLLFTFAPDAVRAQPESTDFPVFVSFYIPCVEEVISGQVLFHRKVWINEKNLNLFPFSKIQIRYEGILTGRKSGLEYTIDFLSNAEFHDVTVTHTMFVRTLMIRQNGRLIARLPMVNHITINANGELVHEFSFADVDCK